MAPIRPGNFKTGYYANLLRIRPAQLGELVKKCLRIKRLLVQSEKGYLFWVDPVSVFGLEMLRTGIYEPLMSRILELLLREEDTFVDVGGNEGYFSVVASSLASRGKVHCIEPQTRLQAVIKENLRLNNFLHAQLHHLAFSSSEGKSFLYLRPTTNSGASSQLPHWKLGSQHETIVTVTMDSFFRENSIDRVRLLKMDCEGAEGEIVKGAQVTLQQHSIDFIALEYHPTICGFDRCLEIDKQIKAYGYQLTKIQGHHIYHLPGNERMLESLGGMQVNCNWET